MHHVIFFEEIRFFLRLITRINQVSLVCKSIKQKRILNSVARNTLIDRYFYVNPSSIAFLFFANVSKYFFLFLGCNQRKILANIPLNELIIFVVVYYHYFWVVVCIAECFFEVISKKSDANLKRFVFGVVF